MPLTPLACCGSDGATWVIGTASQRRPRAVRLPLALACPFALSLLGACFVPDVSLAGKACDEIHPCGEGFECSVFKDCLPEGSLVPASVRITSPAAFSYVNAASQSAFAIAGSCTSQGGDVSVTGAGNATTACNRGAWSAKVDVSRAGEGLVTFTASQMGPMGDTDSDSRDFTKDISAPVATLASFVLAGGALSVTTADVPTQITPDPTDSGSPMAWMRMSEDPTYADDNWIAYQSASTFILSSGLGLKTVYLWLRDAAGNTSSSAASASVVLLGCVIDGVSYHSGDPNPSQSCESCNPLVSTSGWAIAIGKCRIGGACHDSGESLPPFGCQACIPATSQTSWSTGKSCAKIPLASLDTIAIGGSHDGVAGVDSLCRANAKSAGFGGLPGVWRAVACGSTQNVRDIISGPNASKPVVNLHGEQMFSSWSAIFVDQIWASGVSVYKFNDSVTDAHDLFTGCNTDGTFGGLPASCEDWTTKSMLSFANAGAVAARELLYSRTTEFCSTINQDTFTCVLVPP